MSGSRKQSGEQQQSSQGQPQPAASFEQEVQVFLSKVMQQYGEKITEVLGEQQEKQDKVTIRNILDSRLPQKTAIRTKWVDLKALVKHYIRHKKTTEQSVLQASQAVQKIMQTSELTVVEQALAVWQKQVWHNKKNIIQVQLNKLQEVVKKFQGAMDATRKDAQLGLSLKDIQQQLDQMQAELSMAVTHPDQAVVDQGVRQQQHGIFLKQLAEIGETLHAHSGNLSDEKVEQLLHHIELLRKVQHPDVSQLDNVSSVLNKIKQEITGLEQSLNQLVAAQKRTACEQQILTLLEEHLKNRAQLYNDFPLRDLITQLSSRAIEEQPSLAEQRGKKPSLRRSQSADALQTIRSAQPEPVRRSGSLAKLLADNLKYYNQLQQAEDKLDRIARQHQTDALSNEEYVAIKDMILLVSARWPGQRQAMSEALTTWLTEMQQRLTNITAQATSLSQEQQNQLAHTEHAIELAQGMIGDPALVAKPIETYAVNLTKGMTILLGHTAIITQLEHVIKKLSDEQIAQATEQANRQRAQQEESAQHLQAILTTLNQQVDTTTLHDPQEKTTIKQHIANLQGELARTLHLPDSSISPARILEQINYIAIRISVSDLLSQSQAYQSVLFNIQAGINALLDGQKKTELQGKVNTLQHQHNEIHASLRQFHRQLTVEHGTLSETERVRKLGLIQGFQAQLAGLSKNIDSVVQALDAARQQIQLQNEAQQALARLANLYDRIDDLPSEINRDLLSKVRSLQQQCQGLLQALQESPQLEQIVHIRTQWGEVSKQIGILEGQVTAVEMQEHQKQTEATQTTLQQLSEQLNTALQQLNILYNRYEQHISHIKLIIDDDQMQQDRLSVVATKQADIVTHQQNIQVVSDVLRQVPSASDLEVAQQQIESTNNALPGFEGEMIDLESRLNGIMLQVLTKQLLSQVEHLTSLYTLLYTKIFQHLEQLPLQHQDDTEITPDLLTNVSEVITQLQGKKEHIQQCQHQWPNIALQKKVDNIVQTRADIITWETKYTEIVELMNNRLNAHNPLASPVSTSTQTIIDTGDDDNIVSSDTASNASTGTQTIDADDGMDVVNVTPATTNQMDSTGAILRSIPPSTATEHDRRDRATSTANPDEPPNDPSVTTQTVAADGSKAREVSVFMLERVRREIEATLASLYDLPPFGITTMCDLMRRMEGITSKGSGLSSEQREQLQEVQQLQAALQTEQQLLHTEQNEEAAVVRSLATQENVRQHLQGQLLATVQKGLKQIEAAYDTVLERLQSNDPQAKAQAQQDFASWGAFWDPNTVDICLRGFVPISQRYNTKQTLMEQIRDYFIQHDEVTQAAYQALQGAEQRLNDATDRDLENAYDAYQAKKEAWDNTDVVKLLTALHALFVGQLAKNDLRQDEQSQLVQAVLTCRDRVSGAAGSTTDNTWQNEVANRIDTLLGLAELQRETISHQPSQITVKEKQLSNQTTEGFIQQKTDEFKQQQEEHSLTSAFSLLVSMPAGETNPVTAKLWKEGSVTIVDHSSKDKMNRKVQAIWGITDQSDYCLIVPEVPKTWLAGKTGFIRIKTAESGGFLGIGGKFGLPRDELIEVAMKYLKQFNDEVSKYNPDELIHVGNVAGKAMADAIMLAANMLEIQDRVIFDSGIQPQLTLETKQGAGRAKIYGMKGSTVEPAKLELVQKRLSSTMLEQQEKYIYGRNTTQVLQDLQAVCRLSPEATLEHGGPSPVA